ncbi:class A beta-lactamase, subclass A2 [Chryseosolibacter indicus]|uniref:Beta-lactamase n=1 Tax=Chryseosolibacter indicus TaxID=2782351 RepID=A0ABS5VW44_9BACT|nr:class A beta-lactamase, subclass A2 [Chryseosolibacter indicus]MBT1705657.1 class A beta-lactamase, subclass A2 [Chryseosolibacter indicus]
MTTSKLLSLVLLLFSLQVHAQVYNLEKEINEMLDTLDARVGVAISHVKANEVLRIHPGDRYPMQSVFKFHLAMTVLRQVDQKKLSLKQKVQISKDDYIPDTWSPMAKKYPNGGVSLTIAELLAYTISQSDNNGCDILFKLVGGPKVVEEYIKLLGVYDVSIVATEAEMHQDPEIQYKNWSTPGALVELLHKCFNTPVLSKESRDFLWKAMTGSVTGAKRIKGLLPRNTVVAHRTGTSGRDEEGKTAATNDIGVIMLPDNSQLIIAVLIKDSTEEPEVNERTIARISKAAYDYFTRKNQE